MRRILAVIALAALAYIAITVFLVYREMGTRNRVASVLRAAIAYRDQVEAALRESRPLPAPPTTLGPHTRALSAKPDGTIVIEVADDLFPGGRIFYTPSRSGKVIAWKCSVQQINLKFVPQTCRD